MTRVFVFPGQGSQKVGMGAGLFERFPEEVAIADAILGYSIEELCTQDPDGLLDNTEYTQPALFVVNALKYLEKVANGERPDYVAGHSLGEYNALFAAGAFDFATGLRLVQRRGQLMAKAEGGGMAAIVGLLEDELRDELADAGFDGVDIANLNSPTQIVISGPRDEVERAAQHLAQACDAHVVMLRVSGAFHSRYMAPAAEEFLSFLRECRFEPLEVPLLSNAFATLYDDDAIAETLAEQIASPVRWTEIVWRLMSIDEDVTFEELGPGRTLSALIRQVKSQTKTLERVAHYNAHPPHLSLVPAAENSGVRLIDAPTGEYAAATGEYPAVATDEAAAKATGEYPAVKATGEYPAVKATGEHPAVKATGEHPERPMVKATLEPGKRVKVA